MISPIRTRFAPSPTGFIHLGNIRSALYPWAFARRSGGCFILRIEDTDVERSTPAAVQAILDSMAWLGLDFNEGPYYQMQRIDRYQAVIAQLLDAGLAYRCYLSFAELDALRNAQRARGEKPRYDRRWRPEPGKQLPAPPPGVPPTIRFKNPLNGIVKWNDAVKGPIEVANSELDDLIIARPDGTPTYNFCVVVDDLDMAITHVIRGDDHLNNTPRQINIFRALGKAPPIYAHLPTVLNEQGEKMSKRNGAMSVIDYRNAGYLPEAVLNYLARLGWAHGDVEIFSREQFIRWFDLEHLGKSPAQHNPDKLNWLNSQYLKQADDQRLAALAEPFLAAKGIGLSGGPALHRVVALLKNRAATVADMAQRAAQFYQILPPAPAMLAQYLTDTVRLALAEFAANLRHIDWRRDAIASQLKATLAAHQLKMPQLAMPVRLLVMGTMHTPALDAVLELFDRQMVIGRIEAGLSNERVRLK